MSFDLEVEKVFGKNVHDVDSECKRQENVVEFKDDNSVILKIGCENCGHRHLKIYNTCYLICIKCGVINLLPDDNEDLLS